MVTESRSNILMGHRVNEYRHCSPHHVDLCVFSRPSVDHTLGTSAGYYAYIESSVPQKYGDKAWLVSEVVESPMGACLDFWYHMKGLTTGNLTVLHRILDQQPTSLWSMEVSIIEISKFHFSCLFRVTAAMYGSTLKSIFQQQLIIMISFFKVLW